MTLATLVNIASLISSLAVLVSLVYLSQQIRQGALNQRSTMDRGRSRQVGEWLQFIAQPEIGELVQRGDAGDPSLSSSEIRRYVWAMYPLLLHFEDSYYQHRDGMISDAQYASIVGHLESGCSAPGFRATWAHVRSRFPRDFTAFIDGLMQTIPPEDPATADWTAQWRKHVELDRAHNTTPADQEQPSSRPTTPSP